jgi:hypothetical protein
MKMTQNPGYRSLLFIILAFFVGCATPQSPQPQKEEFRRPITIGNGVVLHIPKGLTEQQRTMLISASAMQLEAFEADCGSDTRPVHVWFSRGNGKSIPCGKLKGSFWGCHYGRDGPIWVFMDDNYSAISLYHELVHHNLTIGEKGHSNPRWDSEWKPRQTELRAKIIRRHKRIIRYRR